MYHCFRLRRGQDLYEEIEAYVKAHHIAAGAVVSGVGCVSRWRLRDATGVRVRSGDEDVEIVSLMGTVSEYGCHLHASFSREDLSAFGGHHHAFDFRLDLFNHPRYIISAAILCIHRNFTPAAFRTLPAASLGIAFCYISRAGRQILFHHIFL